MLIILEPDCFVSFWFSRDPNPICQAGLPSRESRPLSDYSRWKIHNGVYQPETSRVLFFLRISFFGWTYLSNPSFQLCLEGCYSDQQGADISAMKPVSNFTEVKTNFPQGLWEHTHSHTHTQTPVNTFVSVHTPTPAHADIGRPYNLSWKRSSSVL